tara:strand:+ start:1855 stop:2025 length:171 start_codon:yes stop_codon:yes gene_type:complete
MSKEKPQWEFYAESLMFQSPNPSQLPWPDFPDLIKPTQNTTKQKTQQNKKHKKEKK